ncbi:biotin-independent malonate decarboxylase subunit gamma [uncultured Ilyobacter sp.]|uniref:biotin-independent malonate decarboxylase subunit gamma n=1 Tax=uncultured Ilyobacter sp. TaxID=544433 RepID=UPI0029C7654E|nr:biotin-independent malonate decarboxylase subunit gamma [uncultured Ilyobacter sp.]
MNVRPMAGKGRKAVEMIVDENSFLENIIGIYNQNKEIAPSAVVGTAKLEGKEVTIIANDATKMNPRFPVVYGGIIGLEEGYKMATAVYDTIETDKSSKVKRPIVLIVDTPGNGPGKVEEIIGMNKSTGSYQLALAEARLKGHPIVAMIIGRAISGAFLCHGLQADRILSLSADFKTMIHVMPITSIARITKLDIETLEGLSKSNPVFASGAHFFYDLGGLEEVINNVDDMRDTIIKHIKDVYQLFENGENYKTGPAGRGLLGDERGGRVTRSKVMSTMNAEFRKIESQFL